MRNVLFTFIFIGNLLACNVQQQEDFQVEEVILRSIMDTSVVSRIPRLSKGGHLTDTIVLKVNTVILDRFMIPSYVQAELEEFQWSGVEFNYQIASNILYISFSGDYLGPYLSTVEDELLFDLKTGELLNQKQVPFPALINPASYEEFLNRYWFSDLEQKFKEAQECADGMEPYCKPYQIKNYSRQEGELVFELTDDCYPHAAEACNPTHSASVAISELEAYLSPLGKDILLKLDISSLGGVEKYLALDSLIVPETEEYQEIASSAWRSYNIKQIDHSKSGIIAPLADSMDIYYQEGTVHIPETGFAVFDGPGGVEKGRLKANILGEPFPVYIETYQDELIEVADHHTIEIGYDVGSLTYFDRKDGFIRVMDNEVSYWLDENEIISRNYRVLSHEDFLIEKAGDYLGYYIMEDEMYLKSKPDEDSDTRLILDSELFEIEPTDEKELGWVKVKVKELTAEACEGGELKAIHSGWLRIVDSNGQPLVRYYSRGC